MQVKAIESAHNSANFGAKIKLANKEIKQLINYHDKSYAKAILDRFEAFEPNQVVEISLKKGGLLENDYLIAKNLNTGYSSFGATEDIRHINYNEENPVCGGFYYLLEKLLNRSTVWHCKFWGNEAAKVKANSGLDLKNHSVFEV